MNRVIARNITVYIILTETQEEEDYLGIMGVTGRQLQVL
jgi:hypothetical protein